MYASINGSSKEMKQILASIVTVSVINRTASQTKQNKTSKDAENLNKTINQLYLFTFVEL